MGYKISFVETILDKSVSNRASQQVCLYHQANASYLVTLTMSRYFPNQFLKMIFFQYSLFPTSVHKLANKVALQILATSCCFGKKHICYNIIKRCATGDIALDKNKIVGCSYKKSLRFHSGIFKVEKVSYFKIK